MDNLSLVIVGHVDHGKSTLIGRLLYDTGSIPESMVEEIKAISEELGKEMEFAYLLDALREEREKNITIDTTQTFFRGKNRNYTIIDAPGHKEFLRNMITGASLASAAILMVDITEGLKEQTCRHAHILSLLGIKQIIVAVNKLDLVEHSQDKFLQVSGEIAEFLKKLNLQASHIIPVSGKDGDNIVNRSQNLDWYSDVTIVEALDSFTVAPPLHNKSFRFPVQGIYIKDSLPVIMGRVESGRVKTGDRLSVAGRIQEFELKELLVWNQDLVEAEAGQALGLILDKPNQLKRGDLLFSGNPVKRSPVITATVFWMGDLTYSFGEKLTFQCTTQEVECTVSKIINRMDSASLELKNSELDRIEHTEVAEVEITLERDVVFELFSEVSELGRFVLIKDNQMVAGGIINC